MEMKLDKKQIWAVFLFEFNMGRKAPETTRNINNTSGPGTANERTVWWWLKKFYKGHESLDDEEHSGQPSEVDTTSWDPSLKLILLQLQEKLLRKSTLTILWSRSIWSKLQR